MIQYRAMAAERGQSGSRACLCSRVAAARSDLPGGKQLGSPSLARSRGPGVHVRAVDWLSAPWPCFDPGISDLVDQNPVFGRVTGSEHAPAANALEEKGTLQGGKDG